MLAVSRSARHLPVKEPVGDAEKLLAARSMVKALHTAKSARASAEVQAEFERDVDASGATLPERRPDWRGALPIFEGEESAATVRPTGHSHARVNGEGAWDVQLAVHCLKPARNKSTFTPRMRRKLRAAHARTAQLGIQLSRSTDALLERVKGLEAARAEV
jgi:hypothetical protein